MTPEERHVQIQHTIERLPKDAHGKPMFQAEGAWNCRACGEEGFVQNARGYFEPCGVCKRTEVLKGESV